MAHAEKRGKRWRGRYKLPSGRWGSVARDADGRPFLTKRAAREYAEDLEADVRRGDFINPRDGRTTIAKWAEEWIESLDVGHLTLRDYRSRLRAVILPEWGNVAVADITPVAYNTWEKKLRDQGYAENSISGVRSTFRTMMEDARLSRLRPDNPIPDRKAGRRGRYVSRRREPERVYPTARQALYVARNAFALRGLGMYAMVLTSYYTGLRIGELAGLTRDRLQLEDVDGTGARIMLEYQSQYVDGKPTLVPAKYDSARGLIIHRGLAELLADVLALSPSEFVFTAPQGGRLLIGGDFYTYTWRPIVDGRPAMPASRGRPAQPGIRPVLGAEGMDPHGVRHGHKVALDEAGHPAVAVEERMGHVLQGVAGTYSHTTLGMELRISEHLQVLWEESLRPTVVRGYGPVPEELISQRSPKRPRKAPKRISPPPGI